MQIARPYQEVPAANRNSCRQTSRASGHLRPENISSLSSEFNSSYHRLKFLFVFEKKKENNIFEVIITIIQLMSPDYIHDHHRTAHTFFFPFLPSSKLKKKQREKKTSCEMLPLYGTALEHQHLLPINPLVSAWVCQAPSLDSESHQKRPVPLSELQNWSKKKKKRNSKHISRY